MADDINLDTTVGINLHPDIKNLNDFIKHIETYVGEAVNTLSSDQKSKKLKLNVPIDADISNLDPAQINKLKKTLAKAIEKLHQEIDQDLAKEYAAKGAGGQTGNMVSKSAETRAKASMLAILEATQRAYERVPTYKVDAKTKELYAKLVSDPAGLDELLSKAPKTRESQLAKLRAYAKHVQDYIAEIDKIRASAGSRTNISRTLTATVKDDKGNAQDLNFIGSVTSASVSLPILASELSSLRKANSYIQSITSEQNIQKRLAQRARASAAEDRKASRHYSEYKFVSDSYKKIGGDINNANLDNFNFAEVERISKAQHSRLVARLNAAREEGKDSEKILTQIQEVKNRLSALKDRERRLGTEEEERAKAAAVERGRKAFVTAKSNFHKLDASDYGDVSLYLKARQPQIVAERGQQQNIMAAHLPGSQEYAAAEAQFNRLGNELNRVQRAAVGVNLEMKGTAGFLHQAALATQQFLRYAVLYGSGFAILNKTLTTVKDAFDLDKSLRTVQAITQAGNSELKTIESTIKNVATATQFSVKEVSQAAQVLAQAGVEIKDLPSVLSVSAKLAATTGSELKSAADVITSLREVFKVDSVDGTKGLADKVAQTLNISKLTVEDLKTVISLGASTAKTSGLKVEQMLGVSASLSNVGIKGSTVATGFRQMLLELLSPDEKLTRYLKNRYAAIGETMTEGEIQAKFKGYRTADDPLQVLQELRRLGVSGAGRSDFLRATDIRSEQVILPLLDNLRDLSKNIAKINQSGAVDRGADVTMQAFNNSLSSLDAALTSLTHNTLNDAIGALTTMTNKVRDLVQLLDIKTNGSGSNSASTLGKALIGGTLAGMAIYRIPGAGRLVRGAQGLAGGLTTAGGITALDANDPTGGAITDAIGAGLLAKSGVDLFNLGAGKLSGASGKARNLWGIGKQLLTLNSLKGVASSSIRLLRGVSPAGLIATAAGLGTYAYSRMKRNADDPIVASDLASADLIKSQTARDEINSTFAPYTTATEGGQAATLAKAQEKFKASLGTISGVLEGKDISKILSSVLSLGAEGIEKGSPAYNNALDKIRQDGNIKIDPETEKKIVEAARDLVFSQGTVTGIIEQQANTIKDAVANADEGKGSPIQKAIAEQFKALDIANQTLLLSGNVKDPADIEKVSEAVAKFNKAVYDSMPKELEIKAKNAAETARHLKVLSLINPEAFRQFMFDINDMARNGMTKDLEELKVELEKQLSDNAGQNPQIIKDAVEAIKLAIANAFKSEAEKQAQKLADEAEKKRREEFAKKKEQEESDISRYSRDVETGSFNTNLSTTERLEKAKAQYAELSANNKPKEAFGLISDIYGMQLDLQGKKTDEALSKFFDVAKSSGKSDLFRDKDRQAEVLSQEYANSVSAVGEKALNDAYLKYREEYAKTNSSMPSERDRAIRDGQRGITLSDIDAEMEVVDAKLQALEKKKELAVKKGLTLEAATPLAKEGQDLTEYKAILTGNRAGIADPEHSDRTDSIMNSMVEGGKASAEAFIERAMKAEAQRNKDRISHKLDSTIETQIKQAVQAGNFEELRDAQNKRVEANKTLIESELKLAEGNDDATEKVNQFAETLRKTTETKEFTEHLAAIDAVAAMQQKKDAAMSQYGPYSEEEGAYRQASGRSFTLGQQAAIVEAKIVRTGKSIDLEQGYRSQKDNDLKLATMQGNVDAQKDIQAAISASDVRLKELTHTMGELRGEANALNHSFTDQIKGMSSEGVLREFQKLNSGYTGMGQRLEGVMAETLDGFTNILTDFITTGFRTTKDLEALHSSMMATAQASGHLAELVASRIGMLNEINASPSFTKESPAVQQAIIAQSTAAQQAAEEAAKRQLAIAQYQEEQTFRENSAGYKVSQFAAEQGQKVVSELVKSTIGEGISSLLGGGKALDNATIDPTDGGIKVHVTNMGGAVAGGSGGGNNSGGSGGGSGGSGGNAAGQASNLFTKAIDWMSEKGEDGSPGIISEKLAGQMKKGMQIMGSAIEIGMGAYSIFNSISQYNRSKKLYDEVMKSISIPQGVPVNAIDPTLRSTRQSDTNYSSFAGFIPTSAALRGSLNAPTGYVTGGQYNSRAVTTGTQQLNNGQMQAASAVPGIRVVNVVDKSLFHDFVSSASGERVIMNTMQRNASTVKEILR